MFYLKSLPVLPATLLALAFSTTASHAGLRDDLPTSEYNALVAIYESTGGDGWENNTGWLDPSADSWFVESSEPHFFRVRVEYVARDQPFPGF